MSRSNKSSRHSNANPAIEPLENRLYRSADLTGVFSGSTPAVLNPADRNRAAIEIENSGDSSATGLVTVDLFAAAGQTPDDASVLLASVTRHVKLKPDGKTAVKFQFAEPSDLPDGSYSLLAQIDASAISNAIETNDIVVAQSPVQATQPFVDLTAENVQGPIKPIFIENNIVVGGPASVTVQNRGTQAAKGTSAIDYYLSPDSTFDSNAFLAGENPASPINLQPGRSEKFKAVLEPPTTTAAGDYFLFAVLTPGGGIVQTNSGDEVAKSDHQVVVALYGNRPTPQPTVPDVTDAGSTEIATGFVGASVPFSSGDSNSCDNSAPPCTSPTTCPTTAPTTNCDPPCDNSQPCDDGNSDQPAQDSCDSSSTDSSDASDSSDTSSDSSTSCDPQQPQPVDANAASAGDGQSVDSTSADATDTSSQPSTDGGQQDASSDNSSDNSGQPDDSQPAPDGNESDGSDDQSSQVDASSDVSSSVDDSGGDDSSYIDDSGD